MSTINELFSRWLSGMVNGVAQVRLAASDVADAQGLAYHDQITNTAAAMGSTADVTQLGLPFKRLVFTKSAGVETNTIDMQLSTRGGCIKIGTLTGGETITISCTNSNDVNLGNIHVRNAAGSVVEATGLAAGTYWLHLG